MNGALLANISAVQIPSLRRLFLVAFMLVAFVFQGYATQTHIHPQDFAATGIVLKASGEPGHKNVPPDDDPARCPICQQITQAGLFMAPAWLLPFLTLFAASTFEFATLVVPHYDTVSHNWRSRGPPLI